MARTQFPHISKPGSTPEPQAGVNEKEIKKGVKKGEPEAGVMKKVIKKKD